ncbi:MAG: sec-independent protein translocase protein TatC [Candidatus Tokpelaia sp. JSC085]|nr:MAG: sec-independent protein translocase protein TatC [Candidatus Tokpelaia sp. JSC085]
MSFDVSDALLIDHFKELRRRLIVSLSFFFLAFLLCFIAKEYILDFLLLPYQWAMKFSGGNPNDIRLQSTQVLETFLTKLKIAAFGGIVLAFPVIAFQGYCFIAPGLYKSERLAFFPFLIASPILFLIGSAFVYCIIAPLVLWFSLLQQLTPKTYLQIEFIAKISEYLDFITSLILAFGLVFQLPVIISILVRTNLLSCAVLVAIRKWAVVIAFIIAAMVTPSDMFSMFGLALPMIMLYEVSILVARVIERKRNRKAQATSDKS